MRYEKKKLFVFIIVLATLIHPVRASVVDQSQEQSDSVCFMICSDWLIAQTFTAGMDGQLEKIELDLTNIFSTELYPCEVSIVNVIDGVPNGSLLGEVYTGPLVDGLNAINFLSESIFLASGVQYGIVITNSDERDSSTSTQWRAKSTDVYAGGSLWVWMPDSGWIDSYQPQPDDFYPFETFYDKDAVFKTYMVPEPATIVLLGLGGFGLLKNRKLFLS